MDAAEIAAELTLALIEKTAPEAMISDKNDKQSSAKWVGKTFEAILIGVVGGIKEANTQR